MESLFWLSTKIMFVIYFISYHLIDINYILQIPSCSNYEKKEMYFM